MTRREPSPAGDRAPAREIAGDVLQGVPVTKAPNLDGWDACILCDGLTTYWWGKGCVPLHPACAETTTHEALVTICRRDGYGPIPRDPS